MEGKLGRGEFKGYKEICMCAYVCVCECICIDEKESERKRIRRRRRIRDFVRMKVIVWSNDGLFPIEEEVDDWYLVIIPKYIDFSVFL